MRTATRFAALAAAVLSLTLASTALAQHHAGQPPADFVQKNTGSQEHKRRGDVNEFGAATKEPDRPFPWMAVLLGLVLCGVASPAAYLAYRSTSKDLNDMKTVGRGANAKASGGRAAAAAEEKAPIDAAATPRDRVWEAVTSVNQWVPVDWVAKTAGLSVDEATDQLNALADEGQLEHASDRAGKPIFRASA